MDICRRHFGLCVLGAVAGRAWAAPSRPKLTIVIIEEVLRADTLEAAWSQFGTGGFRRLAEKGAWFPDCRHLSSTFSACGIANLATGAWPSQHGIVADFWYDRPAKAPVSASPENLLATTLPAQLADESDGRIAVVAISRQHAALFAGTPDARLYFLDERGQFATDGAPPQWLQDYNAAKPPDAARGARWMAVNAVPDAPPLRSLTFDPARLQDFLALYKASPFGQTALFEMAAELVTRERLGMGSDQDLLCIIDGSSALLGYEAGGRSPLMQQMLLQLDRRLENLLGQLGRAVGDSGFNLVVCAAHGVPPEPAAPTRARMAVNGEAIAQAVEAAVKDGYGHVQKYLYPFLYLDSTSRDPEPARAAAGQAALQQPAVAAYYTAGGACSTHDAWETLFRNSFHAKRSGDVMLSYRPEYVEDFGQGRGISYGSFYSYDTRVPLFFYGPQFRGGTIQRQVEAVDVAPTLSRALGIALPSSSMGRVLGEALAE